MSENLHLAAKACLQAADIEQKLRLTRRSAQAWRAGALQVAAAEPPQSMPMPGRPPRPRLVPPRALPRRHLKSEQGRAALLHALAHIEFNAVDLAWDAVYRFRGLPRDYYTDWVQVAEEEALHFTLLQTRLGELGYGYGDFDAHNGLWEMACSTGHDPLLRMALVPRVLEARGLDVTPGMMARLREVGDEATVSILEIILRDEIGHVAVGTRWFRYLCDQRGLAAEPTFASLLQQYMKGRVKGPISDEVRRSAGFSDGELAELKRQAGE